jgi:hypothetical protein
MLLVKEKTSFGILLTKRTVFVSICEICEIRGYEVDEIRGLKSLLFE